MIAAVAELELASSSPAPAIAAVADLEHLVGGEWRSAGDRRGAELEHLVGGQQPSAGDRRGSVESPPGIPVRLNPWLPI